MMLHKLFVTEGVRLSSFDGVLAGCIWGVPDLTAMVSL